MRHRPHHDSDAPGHTVEHLISTNPKCGEKSGNFLPLHKVSTGTNERARTHIARKRRGGLKTSNLQRTSQRAYATEISFATTHQGTPPLWTLRLLLSLSAPERDTSSQCGSPWKRFPRQKGERFQLGYLDSALENAITPSPTTGRPAGRKTRVARTEDRYVLREIIAFFLDRCL